MNTMNPITTSSHSCCAPSCCTDQPAAHAADVAAAVRERYGRAARAVQQGTAEAGCCESSCCSSGDEITSALYSAEETGDLPKKAVAASLGCGNPTALIDLREGDHVLDLGSGGGIDVFLSAKRVGAGGKVYGLDMTDDMLALSRSNQQKAGVTNVEFLKGDIQQIPLPDASVDVVISNCVINLAPDKDKVLKEAFRVLKPGGRFAVSDIVVLGEVSPEVRGNMELWTGCIAGALQDTEYSSKLERAGFTDISVEPWRVYDRTDTGDARFASAFVRAAKPKQ